MMLALALGGLPTMWFGFGEAMALSFTLGSAVSVINFYWLHRTLEDAGDRFQATGNAPSAKGMIGAVPATLPFDRCCCLCYIEGYYQQYRRAPCGPLPAGGRNPDTCLCGTLQGAAGGILI